MKFEKKLFCLSLSSLLAKTLSEYFVKLSSKASSNRTFRATFKLCPDFAIKNPNYEKFFQVLLLFWRTLQKKWKTTTTTKKWLKENIISNAKKFIYLPVYVVIAVFRFYFLHLQISFCWIWIFSLLLFVVCCFQLTNFSWPLMSMFYGLASIRYGSTGMALFFWNNSAPFMSTWLQNLL